VAETIIVQTADGSMPTARAEAIGQARGGVVVIQEAFGITTHIGDVCDRFARSGWTAIAPALFHRQGSPVFAYDDLGSVMPVMQTLTAAGITTDLRASFAHLGGSGFAPERCAVVGFCMGGTVACYAATLGPIGAAVTFYGGGITEGRFGLPPLVELAGHLQAPWLGLYGDGDTGIPVEQVEALRSAAAPASVDTEIVRYPHAQHGFHCADRPAVFDAGAARDAWQRTLDWFDAHIG